MPSDVTTEVVIAAPRERVAFAGDPDRVPDWYANIKSSALRRVNQKDPELLRRLFEASAEGS